MTEPDLTAKRPPPRADRATQVASVVVALAVAAMIHPGLDRRSSEDAHLDEHACRATVSVHGAVPDGVVVALSLREGDSWERGTPVAVMPVPVACGPPPAVEVRAWLARGAVLGRSGAEARLDDALMRGAPEGLWQPDRLWLGVDAPGADGTSPPLSMSDAKGATPAFEVWYGRA